MRSSCGLLKIWSGVPLSTIKPCIEEIHAVGDRAGEAHLVRHHQHGHAGLRQLHHHIQHLFDHLRVERGGRLVKEHDLGLHRQGAGDRHTLLLPAGKLAGELLRLLGDAHPLQQLHSHSLGFLLWSICAPRSAPG